MAVRNNFTNQRHGNVVAKMARVMETVRRDRGEVMDRDLLQAGFTRAEIDSFGDDARARHAQLFQQAAA